MTLGSAACASGRRGNALVIALLVVTTVAALGAGFMHITSSLATRQSVGIDSQRAFYIAEAGLAEGFQAVRMGRTGELGSVTAPARFGEGLLWVTATDTAEGQIRLESTALCGTGRASLALVIEPVDLALGFFADQDLIINSVLLLDGYDSSAATYNESVATSGPSAGELRAYADWLHKKVGNGDFDKVISGPDIDPSKKYKGKLGGLKKQELTELAEMQPALRLGYPEGHFKKGPIAGYVPPGGATEEEESEGPASTLGATTGEHGLLASNGNVQFMLPAGEPVEIWGDVKPGPGSRVTGLEGVTVSGSTDSRAAMVELPMVEVPDVELAMAMRHDDLMPLLVPSGTSGYDEIVVGSGAEIVLRGPSTIVIGELVLEPGAALSFDTRAGDVALYVTRSLDFQPGSLVGNSNEAPNQTTVQVAATFDDPLDPAVKLDATAQFHGTVYAPDSNVRIGSQFEIFGGVIARRLEIGAGARLHFDHIGTAGSPIPRILSWQVVELPNEVQTVFGDPFRMLGVKRDSLVELSDSHDLAEVQLDVTYVDTSGVTRTWSGTEDQFDWSKVDELESVTRDATRALEVSDDATIKSEPDVPETTEKSEPLPSGVRSGVADALEQYTASSGQVRTLLSLAPYSTEEWNCIKALDPGVAKTDLTLLKLAHRAASKTQGN